MCTWFERILDIIAPRPERVVRLNAYSIDNLCPDPRSVNLNGTNVTTLAEYQTRAVEDCIRALKYNHASGAAPLLASLLKTWLAEELAERCRLTSRRIILMPVPLHPSRLKTRGFNQIEQVLQALPLEFLVETRASIETRALVRTRDTAQQTRLSRTARFKNVHDAFALTRPDLVEGAHVYLIDDVATTGATLAEAARPLRESNIPVELIAFARA
jgi:ComF family protein